MAQSKGILPRSDDREVLYKNPRTSGYFIAVRLDPAIDRARVEAWLAQVSGLVDQLVARLPPREGEEKGEKIAAVAVGLAPSFFVLDGAPRFAQLEVPVWFQPGVPLPNAVPPLSDVPLIDADVFFYVASTFEARVNGFVNKLAASRCSRRRRRELFGLRIPLRSGRAVRRVPELSIGRVLVEGSEGVRQVEGRELAAEDNAGDAGEVVVQPRPESGVDDLVAEVVGHVEVPHGIQVPGRPGGVEAVDIEADLVRAEEGAEHLGHRGGDHAVCGGVFRVVGRGQERPPAGLLDRRRVSVVVARYGAEAVGGHGGGIDRGDRSPEQVVVLGIQGGH